jgi:hypothetical protein
MSNAEVIATVTEKLRGKLAAASGLGVTVDPLDKLVPPGQNPALNLYLYQILPNVTWRNMDIPWKVNPGETARAPLALNLHYLLTATAPKQTDAQRHLGVGMLVLHDNPVLDPGGSAIAPFERARITMQSLSLDDLEKLWIGVSMPRLLSVAYEVSVVLIESDQPARSPLPVLSRGTGLDSIEVRAGLYPAIERIEIGEQEFDKWLRGGSRAGRTVAQTNDTIFLYGEGLVAGAKAIIRPLRDPDPKKKLELTDLGGNGRGGLTADLSRLDFAAAKFPAGPCSIALEVKGGGTRTDVTNAVPFSLAPRITSVTPNAPFAIPQDLAITFTPDFVGHEAVALIVANDRILPTTRTPGASLVFRLEGLGPENFLEDPQDFPVRLRVDGVDSISVDLTKAVSAGGRPAFSNVIKVRKP